MVKNRNLRSAKNNRNSDKYLSSIQSNTLDAVETPQTSTDTHTQNLDISVNTLPIQVNDNDLLSGLRGNGTMGQTIQVHGYLHLMGNILKSLPIFYISLIIIL